MPEAPPSTPEARAPSLAPPPAEVIPPPARLLFQRNKEAEGNAGLTFRERVLGVPEGTPTAEAERIAQQVYRALRASLGASTTGRFVSIAVFDHFFSQRPERPPVVVLNWKDWRGDEPEVSFPTQPAHGRVTLQSEPPRAADTIPNAPVAQLPASPTPAPAAPSSAPVSSLTSTTEASVVVPLVKVTAEPVTTVFASATLEKPAVAPSAPAPIPPAVPPPAAPSASTTTEASVVLPLVKVSAEPVTTVFASAAPEVLQPPKPGADSTQELSAQDLVESKKPSADATGELDIPVHVEDDSEDVPVEVEQPQAPPAHVPTPEAPPSAAPQVPAPSAPPPQSLVQAPVAAPQSLVQAPVAAVEPAPPVAPAPASLPPAAPRSIPPSGPLQPGAPQWTAAPEVSSTPDSRPIHRTSMPAMVAVRPPTQGPGRSRGEELLSDVFLGTQDLVFLRESRQACEFVAILGRDMLHASSVLVALYDLDRDELVVEAMLGEGSTVGQRTALVGGVRGDAAIRDRLVALDRAPSGDSFCPKNPGGAVVYAPVRHDRRLLGMLELYRQPDAERFDLDEQHAAAFVAQQLARWLNDFSRRVAIESEQQDQRAKRPR